MAFRPLTLEDLALEYGRTRTWMADNWSDLVAKGKLPKPMTDRTPVWDAAQVYALRDKDLTPQQRIVAAAFRAAMDVAHVTRATFQDQAADDRALMERALR